MLVQVNLGEGNGTPLQYSCLENPIDGGAWWAAVYGVAKSRTRLSDFTLLSTFMRWRRKWQPTPVFLPGECQGWGSLVGCRLWGCTESDTTEVTWQQVNLIINCDFLNLLLICEYLKSRWYVLLLFESLAYDSAWHINVQ